MSYIVILLLSVIYSSVIIFFIHNFENKKILTAFSFKKFLPNNKSEWLWFVFLFVVIFVQGIFITFIYNDYLIDDIKLISVTMLLFVAAFTDTYKHIIENRLIIFGIALRAVIFVFDCINKLEYGLKLGLNSLIMAAIIFVVGFIIVLIFKNILGFGDIKLLSVTALYMSSTGIIVALISSLIISFVYCVFALITKKHNRHDVIPFAPSMLLGTYISVCLIGF